MNLLLLFGLANLKFFVYRYLVMTYVTYKYISFIFVSTTFLIANGTFPRLTLFL